MKLPLSRSRFLAGLQCGKRLWLEGHPAVARPAGVDPVSEFLAQQGAELGRLARQLHPEGRLIAAEASQPQRALQETQAAADAGATVLFEAAASGGGAYARADIMLRKRSQDPWDLVAVKGSGYPAEPGSGGAKDEHLWGLAFQRHAFEAAGYRMGRASLLLVNKDYVRQGPLDPGQLLRSQDVSVEVKARQPLVAAQLKAFGKVQARAEAPDQAIGAHCHAPHTCPYTAQCWPLEGPDHVFKLRALSWSKRFALFHAGRRRFADLDGEVLTDWQSRQVRAQRTGQPVLNRARVQGFLDGLSHPLYFLDFECLNAALPPFDGVQPFAQTVFQYSLHVQARPGAAVVHHEFLPRHQTDPRPELLKSLLARLGDHGSILAYNMAFERGRLRDLATAFPAYERRIQALLPRFQDLITPFQKGWVVHPGFEGSTSIKHVLPALVPGMDYAGLAVADGNAAIRAYTEFLRPPTPAARRQQLRRSLLEYCGQDTLAMVKVVEALRRLAGGPAPRAGAAAGLIPTAPRPAGR